MRLQDDEPVTSEDLAQTLRTLLTRRHPVAARLFRHADLVEAVEILLDEVKVQRWLDRQLKQTRIKSMDFRNGTLMELEPAQEMAATWVAAARTLLGGGENYGETVVTDRVDTAEAKFSIDVSVPELPERYTVTVQRVAPGKLTPHQARQRAEGERDRIRRMVWGWIADANNGYGSDAGDLAYMLEKAGFGPPGEEEEE